MSSTHTDKYSGYLFVVHGEKAVYLGNKKTNLPGEKRDEMSRLSILTSLLMNGVKGVA